MWCINARTYAHTYTYTYTHGCLLIHTHTYTYTYIFTHGCLLIHTHTHTYKGKHEQLDELLTELEGPTLKVVQCSVYAWFTHITHIYTHTHTHITHIHTHTHTQGEMSHIWRVSLDPSDASFTPFHAALGANGKFYEPCLGYV
jgi:hypothetical protein